MSFLRRPDEKEEYVLQWQNYYNDITQDMRFDDDVKAELHQQIDVRLSYAKLHIHTYWKNIVVSSVFLNGNW